ncbi:MAG: SUMF1/EgtB/PvdO family nonheme iron enzyme [Bacteroidota bacterium]
MLGVRCGASEQLLAVSVADFSRFVEATGYVTDSEKFGWSIIQEDVYRFRTEEGATWRLPNAVDSASANFPVTQVSYNDAVAYCAWSNTRLPSYREYWKLTAKDQRPINQNSNAILPLEKTNHVGNVWEITTTQDAIGQIRLAGGSYLCNPYTCNGTSADRRLFVDKTTGNIHISFSVIK